jgi:hypothetical protein
MKNCYVHYKPGDAIQANQKPSGIFELIDQLASVAEKLLEVWKKNPCTGTSRYDDFSKTV